MGKFEKEMTDIVTGVTELDEFARAALAKMGPLVCWA